MNTLVPALGSGKSTHHAMVDTPSSVEKIFDGDTLQVSISKKIVGIQVKNIGGIEKFFAHFPIIIEGFECVIIVSGNIDEIRSLDNIFPDRKHPFHRKISNSIIILNSISGDIIRGDITPDMTFMLKRNNQELVTNPTFWKHLRQRIPSNHPLSLIPQH